MPSRLCTVCGSKVEIPAKVKTPTKSETNEHPKAERKNCGAKALLRVRRRNGRFRGLQSPFSMTVSSSEYIR